MVTRILSLGVVLVAIGMLISSESFRFGTAVPDSVAASLCGGDCTGYDDFTCEQPPAGCASECYQGGSGNLDQNASTNGDVCATSAGRCDRHFESISPCG